ncbi:Uu.00g097240.m01.CDS01 [Anthostomella pinea]|uniref:Uu.00g097240.m01.CDS01 n=1 Tax=Anthostomella pinea TaxID=933095 RepID=A0AAI8VDD1_9PEZI|nr:Uu.00g097240.m01.CDS01 [Anthostomella pinea]
MNPQEYVWDTLDPSTRSIRLLNVLPRGADGTLRLSLRTVDLGEVAEDGGKMAKDEDEMVDESDDKPDGYIYWMYGSSNEGTDEPDEVTEGDNEIRDNSHELGDESDELTEGGDEMADEMSAYSDGFPDRSDETNNTYDAVSYAWGPPTPLRKAVIDDKTVLLRDNI